MSREAVGRGQLPPLWDPGPHRWRSLCPERPPSFRLLSPPLDRHRGKPPMFKGSHDGFLLQYDVTRSHEECLVVSPVSHTLDGGGGGTKAGSPGAGLVPVGVYWDVPGSLIHRIQHTDANQMAPGRPAAPCAVATDGRTDSALGRDYRCRQHGGMSGSSRRRVLAHRSAGRQGRGRCACTLQQDDDASDGCQAGGPGAGRQVGGGGGGGGPERATSG